MNSYTQRKNLFVKEETFSLEELAVRIEEEGAVKAHIPYRSIDLIRLSFMPDRMRPNNYRCSFKAGEKEYSFQSSSIISVANFKNDAGGYKDFVLSFVKKVGDANSSLVLLGGRPKSVYWVSVIAMLLALAGLVGLLFSLGDRFGYISWGKYILIILMLPMVLSYISRNRPTVFTASDIPEKLLPRI